VKIFLENNITLVTAEKNVIVAQLVLRRTTLQKGISVVFSGVRNAGQSVANSAAMSSV
jgi:hypothetical protein